MRISQLLRYRAKLSLALQKNIDMNDYFKTNQSLWDQKTEYHKNSEFYDLKGFKNGKTSLNSIELEELGQDINGKSMLHLQCHFGQDSMSWARMGAKVTGVDLSSKSIELARSLNDELELDVKFVQSNVLELDLDEKFDMVFTSYGTYCWLPDLTVWAKVIQKHLKPGGIFYIADFHPMIQMLDYDTDLSILYPYFNRGTPFMEEMVGTYADREADIRHKEYFWMHSLAEIMTPFLELGFSVESFKEFDYSPYNCFPNQTEVAPGKFKLGNPDIAMPHVFSLKMKNKF